MIPVKSVTTIRTAMPATPSRSSLLPVGILSLTGLLVFGATACERPSEADRIIAESVARHGGERFESAEIAFDFRGAHFRVQRLDGRYRYERSYRDDGRAVLETMHNEGVELRIDGEQVLVRADERSRIETAVNSVVYFAFLPHRLTDPAVQARLLEPRTIRGEGYHTVEVTFLEEGGGEDWEDRFVYWFHEEEGTLDYMAYRYYRDGGGTRFRIATNRREVDGLLIQDYENLTADAEIGDIAEYPQWHAEGRTRLVSTIELENVQVREISEIVPGVVRDPIEGIEVLLGVDRIEYAPGEEIRVVLRVSNRLDVSRTLPFNTSQRYDFILLDASSEVVSRWSDEMGFTQVLGEERLGPGQGVEWEAEIEAPLEPGEYTLQGVVTTSAGELSAVLPVQVVQPDE